MSNTSKIILVTIVATAILLGLGYAAITNITLNITGTASANVNQDNFDVSFVGTPTVSESTYATARIEDELSATIAVSGLTKAGQEVTATYDIKNNSSDLSADLKVAATSSDTEYFFISSKLAKSSLVAKESTTVTVTVRLTKTPIDGNVSTNIDIDLTAMPVQPGEEGTSEGVNDYAQAPDYRNEYGFYYGKPYSTVLPSGVVDTAIFHEDGSIEGYRDNIPGGKSAVGYAVYSPYTITIVGQEENPMTVSSDGTEVTIYGMEYTLNENFEDIYTNFNEEKNEYGFYYGQAYSYINTSNGDIYSYVINEDGSGEYYKNYELELSGSVTFSEDNVIINGITFTPKSEGKYLSQQYGSYTLDPNFWDRYNAIRYVKFGEAYTATLDNGVIQTWVFTESGRAIVYIDGVETGEDSRTNFTRDSINTRIGYSFTVAKDGQTIVRQNGIIYSVDTTFWSRYGLTKPE